MNNHSMNNFMTAQAPMSSMMAQTGGGAAATASLGQQQSGGAGDMNALAHSNHISSNNMGAPAGDNNNTLGGLGGLPPGDLEQLQQAYNRTGDRGSQHHPIAEFLYQLTKMLTDDNSEIIEWVDGRIKVHYPERLEAEVLHKYFRHSKFASFQRQLNYFGFRKIAGKGKMSPCSYVNEAATSDIRSLLLIKRKTNGSAARKAAMQQRTMQMPPGGSLDLRANLSALAAGAAAATGNQQVNRLNNQAFNPAALFSQNGQAAAAAAAAGLGQFNAMQQKSFGSNLFLNNENAMSFLMSGQKQSSAENLMQQQNGMSKTPSAPSIEQLHAQLAASLSNRSQNGFNPQLNPASMSLASAALNNNSSSSGNNNNNNGGGGNHDSNNASGPASAAMSATAALNNLQQQQNNNGSNNNNNNNAGGAAGAATAALQAAGGVGSNLFDSATNLKSLVGEQQHRGSLAGGAPGPAGSGSQTHLGTSAASQQLLNGGLPSSNTLFGGTLSSASFGNLLASSNRLSSILSLNSFLSRDPSMADLVMPQGGAAAQQLAASQAAGAAAAGLSDNNFGGGGGVPRFQ